MNVEQSTFEKEILSVIKHHGLEQSISRYGFKNVNEVVQHNLLTTNERTEIYEYGYDYGLEKGYEEGYGEGYKDAENGIERTC